MSVLLTWSRRYCKNTRKWNWNDDAWYGVFTMRQSVCFFLRFVCCNQFHFHSFRRYTFTRWSNDAIIFTSIMSRDHKIYSFFVQLLFVWECLLLMLLLFWSRITFAMPPSTIKCLFFAILHALKTVNFSRTVLEHGGKNRHSIQSADGITAN